ncbi:STAS domain-containing protein [Streptomyces sp. NRRL B-1347]|uniref:STAS domain-containing protein n=1 Tax=Streptomyces sp. NRRL B-1347 TaxID=1476877 RepID=UPI001F48CF24|nr:STAS domain-containing protein [Streptomyces sp. NRRL B-1347]
MRRRQAGQALVAELHGEVDIAAVKALARTLHELTGDQKRELIVDLRHVTFIDCSGLGVLCAAHNRLAARGLRLRLVVDRPFTLRMLRMCKLDRAFLVFDSLSAAQHRVQDGQRLLTEHVSLRRPHVARNGAACSSRLSTAP